MKTIFYNTTTAPSAPVKKKRHSILSGRTLCAARISLFLALLGSVAMMVILSLWAIQIGRIDVLASLGWMSAIVLSAVAVDAQSKTALLALFSGAMLAAAALACFYLAPEYGVFPALLISPWLVTAWWNLDQDMRQKPSDSTRR